MIRMRPTLLSVVLPLGLFSVFPSVALSRDVSTIDSVASSDLGGKGHIGRLAPIAGDVLSNLDLDEAVRLAEERNPAIQQRFHALTAARNQLGSAYATWWPTITADLEFGWYGEKAYYNYTGALAGLTTAESSTSGASSRAQKKCSSSTSYLYCKSFSSNYGQGVSTLDLDWTIYDPARQPLVDKNQSLVDEANSDYVIARRDYALKTRESFVELQRYLAGVQTSSQLVDNDRLLLRLSQARKRLGVASDLDVAKQITVLKTDEVNQVDARQNARVAQAKLAQLLNDPLASSIAPASALAPLGGWQASLEATIQSALSYRKVIEKQLSIVRQNEQQARIEMATYRPTISLVNSLYWTKGVGYTGLGPPWIIDSARSDLWDAQSVLTITFTGFDGGKARMSAESSKAKALAAKSAAEDSINSVVSEVREYFSRVQEGRMAVVVASERVDAASSALRLQSMRFTAGYGTITDVVQSQQDLTQGVDAYIQQLGDYNLALVNLSRASGMDYVADPDLTQKVGDPLSQVRIQEYLGLAN